MLKYDGYRHLESSCGEWCIICYNLLLKNVFIYLFFIPLFVIQLRIVLDFFFDKFKFCFITEGEKLLEFSLVLRCMNRAWVNTNVLFLQFVSFHKDEAKTKYNIP